MAGYLRKTSMQKTLKSFLIFRCLQVYINFNYLYDCNLFKIGTDNAPKEIECLFRLNQIVLVRHIINLRF
jgi:hypothetical protein